MIEQPPDLAKIGTRLAFGMLVIFMIAEPDYSSANPPQFGEVESIELYTHGDYSYFGSGVILQIEENLKGGFPQTLITNANIGEDLLSFESGIGNRHHLFVFKYHSTRRNPLLKKFGLLKGEYKWLPSLSNNLKGKLVTRVGHLRPVVTDFPFRVQSQVRLIPPTQILYGSETGLFFSKRGKDISLSSSISSHITFSSYGENELDNFGFEGNIDFERRLSPSYLRFKWEIELERYNPDKYFFLENGKTENRLNFSLGYDREKYEISFFDKLLLREGQEFKLMQNTIGIEMKSGNWLSRTSLTQDLLDQISTLVLSISKEKGGSSIRFSLIADLNTYKTISNNAIICSYGLKFGKKVLDPIEIEDRINKNEGPFGVPTDYTLPWGERLFGELNTLNQIIRYFGANVDYGKANVITERQSMEEVAREVYKSGQGVCSEQSQAQVFFANKNGYEAYRIEFYPYALAGYDTSLSRSHAFTHGIDNQKTGREFIWEYGTVYQLKYKSPLPLELTRPIKLASILSNYNHGWEEGYHFSFNDLILISKDENISIDGREYKLNELDFLVELIPQSGSKLFIGDTFRE